MAHFVKLDDNNVVVDIIVIADEDCQDADGNESEDIGIAFCQSLMGEDTIWKQTSYNHNMRVRYGALGYTYDSNLDAFIQPKPYPSWTLNTLTADWDPPTPDPSDENNFYIWNEDTLSWQHEEV